MNWSIFNPLTTIRLWTIDGNDWYGGRFKSFWLKRNALKAAENFKSLYLFVSLCCELTGRVVYLKENPDKIGMFDKTNLPVYDEIDVSPSMAPEEE